VLGVEFHNAIINDAIQVQGAGDLVQIPTDFPKGSVSLSVDPWARWIGQWNAQKGVTTQVGKAHSQGVGNDTDGLVLVRSKAHQDGGRSALACVVVMRVQGADWTVLGMMIHGAVGARQSGGLRVLAWRGMVGTTNALRHGAAP